MVICALLFQSTPPHGGRQIPKSAFNFTKPVSIHAPAWGATKFLHIFRTIFLVSIHAPAWGATQVKAKGLSAVRFQSTPPHGGRQPEYGRCFKYFVSIHAPAWGATFFKSIKPAYYSVSIHAPAWGATFFRRAAMLCVLGFNPRPRMGGDFLSGMQYREFPVSIHAPAWGATF